MSPIPIDKKLYNYVKKLADSKFESKTGIYKSSWIVKEYLKRGGKYLGKKPTIKSPGLKRWYKEDWVDLNRPKVRLDGKIIEYEKCGRKTVRQGDHYPLCRPSIKISKDTPKTYKEIPEKDILKAKKEKAKIKGSGNIKFGGSAQYFGKKSKIMIKVPKSVKNVALYSFKIRDLGFGGGVETGWKRAKQLSTQEEIPIEDLRYMRSWFARHVYTSYPSYKKWIDAGKPIDSSWYSKHGIIAWLIWSGDAGFKWVNSKKNINLLNKYFNKNYKPIVLPN